MIYRLFAVLSIVAVIIALLLLSRQQDVTPATTTVQGSGWDEGYSAHDAKLVTTGVNGLPLYTLNAATIRQVADQLALIVSTVLMKSS